MKRTHRRLSIATMPLLGVATFLTGCAGPPNETTQTIDPATTSTSRTGTGPTQGGTTIPTIGNSSLVELESLRGRDFEIAYLSQMVAHYEASVAMARQALNNPRSPEVTRYARSILATHTPKIAQLTQWLRAGYGVAPVEAQKAFVQADVQGMAEVAEDSEAMFYAMRVFHDQAIVDASQFAAARSGNRVVRHFAQDIIAARSRQLARNRDALSQI